MVGLPESLDRAAVAAEASRWSDAVSARAWHALAEQRELVLAALVESYLPPRLRWARRSPRLLRALYRVRPAWQPVVATAVDVAADRPVTVHTAFIKGSHVAVVLREDDWLVDLTPTRRKP
jgi:hypothetical protein